MEAPTCAAAGACPAAAACQKQCGLCDKGCFGHCVSSPQGRAWPLRLVSESVSGKLPSCLGVDLIIPRGARSPEPRPPRGRQFQPRPSVHLGRSLIGFLFSLLPSDAGFRPGPWEDGAVCVCVCVSPDPKSTGCEASWQQQADLAPRRQDGNLQQR